MNVEVGDAKRRWGYVKICLKSRYREGSTA